MVRKKSSAYLMYMAVSHIMEIDLSKKGIDMMEHDFKWKNNGKLKVCLGLGTRPEIIRLAAVIKRFREYFDTCVIYYNQNWDRNLSTVFWEDF